MTIQDLATITSAVILASAVIAIAVYAWLSFSLSSVFAKLGVEPWKAWVPVLSTMTILRLGTYSPVWVVALFLPVAQIAGLVVFFHAVHVINRKFGLGGGYTVLAVFLLPVWATVLGFGKARPSNALGDEAPGRFDARVAVLQGHTAPTVSAPPVEPEPATTTSPWTPPLNLLPNVPTGVGVRPAAQQAVPVVERVRPPIDEPIDADDDLERTVITKRRRRISFQLEIAGLAPVALTSTIVFLGRNPAAPPTQPAPQLVSLVDPSKTMSKTHARIDLVNDAWTITDLNSTNGVVVISESGEEIELQPGVTAPLDSAFLLGELSVRVVPRA